MAETIFVNTEGVKSNAGKIRTYAGNIKEILEEISTTIASTESNYQSEAAEDMREQFRQLKPAIDRFESYLNKVATYLEMNVADTTTSVMATNVQNITNIRKPE